MSAPPSRALPAEVEAMLARLAATAPPEGLSIAALREAHARLHREAFAESGLDMPAVGEVRELAIPVAGGEVRARVYSPLGDGPWPAYLHCHGGRWTLGSIDWDTVRYAGAEICATLDCVVVDVEYRLAPEHRFPTAPEDCYAALLWIARNAERLRIDPDRIAVGGESAGGNIAAALCLIARDRGGPRIALQLLEMPAPDLARMNDYPSAEEFGEGYGLDRPLAPFVVDSYLSGPEEARLPYASPILAENLGGLPPTVILTAEFDLLRDSGEAYGAALAAAGVPVSVRRRPGHVHASPIFLMAWGPTREWREQRLAVLHDLRL